MGQIAIFLRRNTVVNCKSNDYICYDPPAFYTHCLAFVPYVAMYSTGMGFWFILSVDVLRWFTCGMGVRGVKLCGIT